MDSVQTVEIENDLEILEALDSPQLDGLAPELKEFRTKAQKIAADLQVEGKGCKSCKKKKLIRGLAVLAVALKQKVEENADLQKVFPTLLTTARQLWQKS